MDCSTRRPNLGLRMFLAVSKKAIRESYAMSLLLAVIGLP